MGISLGAYGLASLDDLLAQRHLEAQQAADRAEKIRQFNVEAEERARAHDLNLQIHQAAQAQAAQQRQDAAALGVLHGATPPTEDIGPELAGRLRQLGQGGFLRTTTTQAAPGAGVLETQPGEPTPQLFKETYGLPQGGFAYQEKRQEEQAKAEAARAAATARGEQMAEAARLRGEQATENERQRAADREQQIRLAASLRPPRDEAAPLEKSLRASEKDLNTLAKPVDEGAARLGRLQDTLRAGTPQADALVAPELLTVMAGGQGSGLRMNEAEIARIVGGRSVWENLKASAQHWALNPETANSITPAQRQQIRSLVAAVATKINQKQARLQQAREALLDATDTASHHRVVNEARRDLNVVDTGEGPAGGITTTPTRRRYDINGNPLP